MHIEGETDFTAPDGACYIGLSFASNGDASYLNSLTEFRQTTGLTVTAAPALSGNGVQHDSATSGGADYAGLPGVLQ